MHDSNSIPFNRSKTGFVKISMYLNLEIKIQSPDLTVLEFIVISKLVSGHFLTLKN